MSIYVDAINKLLEDSKKYRNNMITLEVYQTSVWNTAEKIVLVEEKEFRSFLQNAEGKLELIRFTIDTDKIFNETLKVVQEVEARLLKEI